MDWLGNTVRLRGHGLGLKEVKFVLQPVRLSRSAGAVPDHFKFD